MSNRRLAGNSAAAHMRGGHPRQALRARQRGVAAVFTGIAILALLTSVFLGINIGQLYYAQRDLQKQATLGALAGVQVASGCSGAGVPGTLANVTTAVQNSLARNANSTNAGAALLTGIGGVPPVQLGDIENSTGIHTFQALAAGNPNINAVQVNLSEPEPTLLGSGFFPGATTNTLVASATAQQPAIAGFALGTSVATLNNGALNSLLTGLLGTNVSLSAVSYQGLADATVNLGNLMVAAGVTDLSQLLSLQTTLPGALNILAEALGNAGSGTAAGLVSGLAGQSYTGSNPTEAYFGQIFNDVGGDLNPTVSDALSAVPFIDGLNLLDALGQAASNGKTMSIAVPVGITLPLGLGGTGIFVKILQPEQFALGPAGYAPNGSPLTSATSAQVVVEVRTGINVLGLATANIAIDINAANGESILTNVSCPSYSVPNSVATATIQTTTSLITETVGTFTGSPTANPPQDPPASGAVVNVLGLLTITATKSSGFNPGTTVTQSGSAPFPDAFPEIPSTTPLGTAVSSLLSSGLSINVLGLGISVSGVLSAITTPLTSLLDSVLAPLLAALGVGLGDSNVTLEGITTAQPVIVQTCVPGAAAPLGCPT
jgi:uncharacterized membrane protein